MAYNYGKVGFFALATLAGREHGVVAGLARCGLLKSVINISCILMQYFKIGNLTLTSPRAMLLSQAIGTAKGCVVSPLSFFLFYSAFDVGNPNGEYKAPYAVIYRNLAIWGVQGFSVLPCHCLQLCCRFFGFAVGVKLNSKKAEQMVPVVASGLICNEGLWTLPASVLSLAKINPPMCMKFLDS
ncbi:YELLOW STRIPE like 1 [Actinidia rufa]|uniref:YELLOW STRIPE like 1 n=1 Tax=Actinidia rufa TaxID=165716 RepID=A0A7J0D7K2_9ERIC|nr:YELLOW STRIPE like 1 [Actinidia rufa]